MTVMTVEREPTTLKQEQAYIRKQIGVSDEDSDSGASGQEGFSCDELDDDNKKNRASSSDGGYVSSSEEEAPSKNADVLIDLTHVQNETEDFGIHQLPLDIQDLLAGLDVGLPDTTNVPINEKPVWLNMKKFKMGQQFAQDHYAALNFAEMLGLHVLFATQGALQPLIFTEKSSTPFTAFSRYLSTVLRVKSWFEHDVWREDSLAYRNLKSVRTVHLGVSKRLNSLSYKSVKDKLTLIGSDKPIWAPLTNTILQDFQNGCPYHGFKKVFDKKDDHEIMFNQFYMSVTQFGFIGLMVLFPEKFGAAGASDEELEGFIHLWRGLGYLLGIEDKYNFCNGSLQQVRQRCHFIIDNFYKPSFRTISEDWEHMNRCIVEGMSYFTPGLTFESSLLYLCWVLDIPAPRLSASLTWWQSFMFLVTKVTMCFTLRLPGMSILFNWMVRRSLSRASSWSPQTLEKLERKSHQYEKNSKFSTRL